MTAHTVKKRRLYPPVDRRPESKGDYAHTMRKPEVDAEFLRLLHEHEREPTPIETDYGVLQSATGGHGK